MKKLKIYKLTSNVNYLDNRAHEIVLIARNEEEARSNAGEYAYQFSEATNVKCYEIGVAPKEALRNGCLESAWMNVVSVHIENEKESIIRNHFDGFEKFVNDIRNKTS